MGRIRLDRIAVIISAGCLILGACGGGGGGGEDAGDDAADTAVDEGDDATPDAEEDSEEDVPTDGEEDAPEDAPPDIDLDFDWEAPELPDRYGLFQVQQVAMSGQRIALAGGDVGDFSSVTPERPMWADEDCTVTEYPPTGGATGFVRMSAGTPVTMTGGTGSHSPISCDYSATDGYVCDVPSSTSTTVYAAGDTITIDAPGDEVVAFNFDVTAPPAPTLTSATNISKSSGYTAQWSEFDADSIAIIIVTGELDVSTGSLSNGIQVQCIVELGDPPITQFPIPLPALHFLDNTAIMPVYIAGVIQLMGLNGYNETLSDSTVIEAMLLNGTGSLATVED
jgi:hypothetical protein